MNQKKGGTGGVIALIVVIIIFIAIGLASCGDSSGHAPGYGNTSKCTICGKPATHSTGNYGYCDKHWQDAINYKGN